MEKATRKHASRKAAKPTAPPTAPADPRHAVIKALQADTGPLIITIAGNMVNGKVQVIDNSTSPTDVAVLMEWLDSARGYLQGKLLQAAEARGRAAAATQAPGGQPGDGPGSGAQPA